jgi:hypothetical protein
MTTMTGFPIIDFTTRARVVPYNRDGRHDRHARHR